MVDLFYTHIDYRLEFSTWNYYFSLLPPFLQQKVERFYKWEDKQAALFGKILLLEGLKKYGLDKECLNHLCYNSWDKPYLKYGPCFNISHSGNLVVCAVNKKNPLGIDVEKISDIKLDDFEAYMSSEQWEIIRESSNPHATFFSFWTIKESVIKADGKGLSIPLTDIVFKNLKIDLNDKIWHLTELKLHKGYACCLACDKPVLLNIKKIDIAM